ncbi:MAG TPA: isochorismatase family protein, partial [Candidatus Obscuribacter sp.]|nr:isochorismatase family protein [Candidatus Obscuribacter sp.]
THGVQNTTDAEFHKDLDRSMVALTVRKGMDKRVDSYSAFYDNGKSAAAELKKQYPFLGTSTGLAEWMVQKAMEAGADVIEVDVIGLATDFCVKFSALDAAAETFKGNKFKVRVILDGCRGLGPNEPVVSELQAAGIEVINSDVVLPVVTVQS